MDTLDDDPGLSLAIITGAGGSFCAGMDLKAFARGENVLAKGEARLHRASTGQADHRSGRRLCACRWHRLAPTDLIVAADNSAFGIPEVKRGLVAGAGACCGCLSGFRTKSRWVGIDRRQSQRGARMRWAGQRAGQTRKGARRRYRTR